ncbi:SNF2 family N-terminal domain-containing protein [Amylostereum chailletii]|nr:SNF2 family N-terminal domain-containing protein [Amylostereum chailletii]
MEDLRRQLAQQPYLIPAGQTFDKPPPSVITVSSTNSSPEVAARNKQQIYEVSDSDDDAAPANPKPVTTQSNVLQQRSNIQTQARPPPGPGKPIHIPSNKDIYAPRPTQGSGPVWETFKDPVDSNLYDPRKTAAEAEKDLKELLEQSFDGHEEGEDGKSDPIDMKDAIVEGFHESIRLLPHQVVGRKWMAERESGKKMGGILADDMGLGKTIQTLVRIVDGRPRKSDKNDGWAAGTLVIAPVGLVSQWAAEIKRMAPGYTVIEHHGASRTTNPEVLKRAHVVITSYAIVSSEHGSYVPDAKDESKGKSKSKSKKDDSDSDELESESEHFGRAIASKKKPAAKRSVKDALFRVKWFRIVLDEAHNIKNRNTKAAQACCALEGKFRWCLTGTPLQNNVEELYSLLKFLRIRPLNDWQTFNEQINKPVKSGKSTRAMKRLHVVLRAVMLRRKKTDMLNGKPLIELPDRTIEVVPCEFDPEEREFYNALEGKIEAAMEKFMKAGDVMKNYTHVLVLLLRLRQACNHPSLVSKDFRMDKDAVEPRAATKEGDEDVDALADALGGLGMSTGKRCQMCQTVITSSNASSDEGHCTDCVDLVRAARRKSLACGDLPPDSAKIRKIVELLEQIEEREDEDGESTNEKTIVFSQFTSMLDIVEIFLKAKGINFVRYDGSMSKDKREASLNKIKSDRKTKVILISFKAGSTGLNLTACNNVILVDLWWNPALEDQAFDRAHRFGQTRNVNIYKLTIEKTVEERILHLQEQKRQLANAALSGDKFKNSKLAMEDVLALFRSGGRDDEDED